MFIPPLSRLRNTIEGNYREIIFIYRNKWEFTYKGKIELNYEAVVHITIKILIVRFLRSTLKDLILLLNKRTLSGLENLSKITLCKEIIAVPQFIHKKYIIVPRGWDEDL